MLTAALLSTLLVQSEGAWTQILVTNQLQCVSPYVMTVGYPQGKKELVARIEKDNQVLTEQKLPKFTETEVSIMDIDESGCDEALIDVSDGEKRAGLFVSFPGGKPKITLFPTTTVASSKAKRFATRVRVYSEKKGKLCVADYRVKKDALEKVSEDCY